MRLLLVCVGRPKAGPERDLAARYVERAARPAFPASSYAAVRPTIARGKRQKPFGACLHPPANVIALDVNGAQMTSRRLATELGRARDQGIASAAFVIGGPDGLEPAFLASASLTLSFGAMTWPHQLVRIMVAEQIYRAVTILASHPYHRV
jgi:23S rRNA (pseudouridine1915-N3)-methyltransferase